jgi:hypothetical protein
MAWPIERNIGAAAARRDPAGYQTADGSQLGGFFRVNKCKPFNTQCYSQQCVNTCDRTAAESRATMYMFGTDVTHDTDQGTGMHYVTCSVVRAAPGGAQHCNSHILET